MKNLIIIGQILLIPLWLLVSGCGSGDDINHPPKINDIKISPEPPVYTGQTVSLEALATDADRDPITYIWSASNGKNVDITNEILKVESSNASAKFKADVPDTYLIKVVAKDPKGEFDTRSFQIAVMASDNPVISILSPKNNDAVQGIVNITVRATDDKGVTKVEFYIDGTLIAEKTSFPFSYSWDTTLVTAGNHVIEAKAYDSDGKTGNSDPIVIAVQQPSQTKIEITEPVDGASVDWKTTVKGTSAGVPKGQNIWVFINPHTVGSWYPQSPSSIRVDGTWRASCYFGREGQDVGIEFDIGVILVDDDRAKKLTDELEKGDIQPRPLFDPILALITVKRK